MCVYRGVVRAVQGLEWGVGGACCVYGGCVEGGVLGVFTVFGECVEACVGSSRSVFRGGN